MVSAARQYGADLQRSFAAAYALLERPKIARQAVVLLLSIQTGLLAYSAYVHSPTLNEPGHLVAGLSYWKFGCFDVYNVNPPLVKLVAALPVLAVGYEEDWSAFRVEKGVRQESIMGEDFVVANQERAFYLFAIARLACIPFSWLGGIVCYLWARDLFSRPAGVAACAIWCFEPNIIAHASLMTPDAHATALGLAACYTFWRWLKKPTWAQALITGFILGLAELAKTTLILFYPLWPVLWIVYRWPDRHAMKAKGWMREANMLLARMAIGLYVLNLGYGFEGTFKPLREFEFVSRLFTGSVSAEMKSSTDGNSVNQPSPESYVALANSLPTNRFADNWFGALPVPFPANYVEGIDVQQKDFEEYGLPSYLRGEWRDHGWWYYYLYAVAIKVPLSLWMLVVFSIILRYCHREPQRFETLPIRSRDDFVLLILPLAIFAVVSSKTQFSAHMRYVLPTFPFVFIWAVGALGLCNQRLNLPSYKANGMQIPLAIPIVATLCWLLASSIWIYPHSLSYFNELIGGPLNGPRHLLGSNVDWGQDFGYVQRWQERALESGQSELIYVGNAVPSILGMKGISSLGLPPVNKHGAPSAPPRYAAVSVNAIASDQSNKGSAVYSRHAPCIDVSGRVVSRCGYSLLITSLNAP